MTSVADRTVDRALLPAAGLPSGLAPEMLARLAGRVVTVDAREAITVLAPFTLERLGDVPRCEPPDVEEALRRARAAQPELAATPARDLARVLLRFHDLLLARRAQCLDLVQLESGKARAHAL